MHFRVAAAASLWTIVLSGLSPAIWADDAATRYISDETAITLRADKGMNAAVEALLKSGAKVELIENDGASGYSRVRVAPGREGWVLTRYLSTEPAARERLAAAHSALAEETANVRKLEGALVRLRQSTQIGGSAVRAASDPPAIPPASLRPSSDPVLVGTGAGLFIAGLLTGLLIPMVRRAKPRKRWSAQL